MLEVVGTAQRSVLLTQFPTPGRACGGNADAGKSDEPAWDRCAAVAVRSGQVVMVGG